MLDSWTAFLVPRLPEFWQRLGEHLSLMGMSISMGIAAAIPLALLASRSNWLRGPLLSATAMLQTIPSLAMLAILLALFNRIGTFPAVTALTLYALLPILRNTLAGLDGTSPDAVEAARAMGMTDNQLLFRVKFPLALPVIIAGVRTAAVLGVGIATLSAFVGAGGLGQFINRGLALSNNHLILLGALPAALLALAVDASIAALERGLAPVRGPKRRVLRKALRLAAASMPLLSLVSAGFVLHVGSPVSASASAGRPVITIGSKDFTEQYILAELMAQTLEARGFAVERRFGLGGTIICHEALRNSQIDLYAEYTGTALTAVLKRPVERGSEKVLKEVGAAYLRQFNLSWLPPFGFNNTYALAVRKSDAERRGWKNISDLRRYSRGLKAGFTGEFAERPDGYPGLASLYQLVFGEVKDMDSTLMYKAVSGGQVDVISAFSTDGRILTQGLAVLADDRDYFPPYDAAPVIRKELLNEHPEVGEALMALGGALNDRAMQELNSQVDEGKQRYVDVVKRFLEHRGAAN